MVKKILPTISILSLIILGICIGQIINIEVVETNNMPQLKRPLDSETKSAIRECVEEFLKEDVFDLVWRNTIRYTPLFESLDGWFIVEVGAGSIVLDDGTGVLITTGTSQNDSERMIKYSNANILSFSKRSKFRIEISAEDATNETVYLGIGEYNGDFYGLKIIDSSLYGVIRNSDTGNETTKLIQTISSLNYYLLEVEYDPSVGVKFSIINDTAEKTEKCVIPSDINMPKKLDSGSFYSSGKLFDFYIKTNENDFHRIRITFFDYIQETNFK